MMHTILEWGISVIVAIQSARTPLLDQFFVAMSNMGSEYFYFAALPIICTMVNRVIGIRIALTILASVMINSLIKTIVAEPRPFILDPSVGVIAESGFGFPSGHTQQAALFWGLAIHYLRRRWVIFMGALFVGLLGLARVYLGVHYPTDVIGSVLLAAALLFAHRLIVKHADSWWNSQKRFIVFCGVFAIAILGSIYLPAKDMISAAGLGAGLVAGLLFYRDMPPLSASLSQRLQIAALTAVTLLALFFGLKLLLPAKGTSFYPHFSFLRYFSCGLTLAALPIFLERYKLGGAKREGS